MGSQTLEILRQGVWASLTGGWFYDPHHNLFCNTVHLYIWLFLLCVPFSIYLYFPPASVGWFVYCILIAILFTGIKLLNHSLHRMYDTSQCIIVETTADGSGAINNTGNEVGVELSMLRSSGAAALSDNESVTSIEYHKPNNSTIDLKVDVHRKNSSESSIEDSGVSTKQEVVATTKSDLCVAQTTELSGPIKTRASTRNRSKPVHKRDHRNKSRRQGIKELMGSDRPKLEEIIIDEGPFAKVSRRYHECSHRRGPNNRDFFKEWLYLDGNEAAGEPYQSKFARQLSSDSRDNSEPNVGPSSPKRRLAKTRRRYIEDEESCNCTKSAVALASAQTSNMRRNSNSTMSTIQLPLLNSTAHLVSHMRRHSNNADTGFFASVELGEYMMIKAEAPNCDPDKIKGKSPGVRRIKSAALEIGCPPPSVSNLSPHPNSVETIGGQVLKNPKSSVIPPPSKCLTRGPHFNLYPNNDTGEGCSYPYLTYGSEIVYPIAEISDEMQTSQKETDLDSSGESYSDYDDEKQFRGFDWDAEQSPVARSSDSDYENNGSRSPLLDRSSDVRIVRTKNVNNCRRHCCDRSTTKTSTEFTAEKKRLKKLVKIEATGCCKRSDKITDTEEISQNVNDLEKVSGSSKDLFIKKSSLESNEIQDQIENNKEISENKSWHTEISNSSSTTDTNIDNKSCEDAKGEKYIAPETEESQLTCDSKSADERSVYSVDWLFEETTQNISDSTQEDATSSSVPEDSSSSPKSNTALAETSSNVPKNLGAIPKQMKNLARSRTSSQKENKKKDSQKDKDDNQNKEKNLYDAVEAQAALVQGLECLFATTNANTVIMPQPSREDRPRSHRQSLRGERENLHKTRKRSIEEVAQTSTNTLLPTSMPLLAAFLNSRVDFKPCCNTTENVSQEPAHNVDDSQRLRPLMDRNHRNRIRKIKRSTRQRNNPPIENYPETQKKESTISIPDAANSVHFATAFEDTSDGAIHCFMDEYGNWMSYTFDKNSSGQAQIQPLPMADKEENRSSSRKKNENNDSQETAGEGSCESLESEAGATESITKPKRVDSIDQSSSNQGSNNPLLSSNNNVSAVVPINTYNTSNNSNKRFYVFDGGTGVHSDQPRSPVAYVTDRLLEQIETERLTRMGLPSMHINFLMSQQRATQQVHQSQNIQQLSEPVFSNLPSLITSVEMDGIEMSRREKISKLLDNIGKADQRKSNSYYKYKIWKNFEVKIAMDRLKLLALFDRNLTYKETFVSIVLALFVAILGSMVLNLGYYRDIYAFWFCFIMAGSQYSLLKSVQPDSASPVHGFNKMVLFSRPIYFCICTAILCGVHSRLQEISPSSEIDHKVVKRSLEAAQQLVIYGFQIDEIYFLYVVQEIISKFLLFFPLAFSLGLFPQFNTFMMYLLEQIDMHIFGGNATSSPSAAVFCVSRSLAAVGVLYGFAYSGIVEGKKTQHQKHNFLFSLFCALLVPISYHLSRSCSDYTLLWTLIKKHLIPPELYTINTVDFNPETDKSEQHEKEMSVDPTLTEEKKINSESNISKQNSIGSSASKINFSSETNISRSQKRSQTSSVSSLKMDPRGDVNSASSLKGEPATENDDKSRNSNTMNSNIKQEDNEVPDEDMEDPLPKKLQETVYARLKNDVIVCSFLGLFVFGLHSTTIFTTLRPQLNTTLWLASGVLGVVLHCIVPGLRSPQPARCLAAPALRSREHALFEVTQPAHLMCYERIYVYLCFLERNVVYPGVVVAATAQDAAALADKFGDALGALVLSIAALKCLRHAYSDTDSQYLILVFAVLVFQIDLGSWKVSETFIVDYFVMAIIFHKVYELLLKLQFVVTYIAPWQITWGSAFHAFAQPFSVPHAAALFAQAAIAAILSAPLAPFLGSAIFMTSYVRPIKFWERDYNTKRVDQSNTRLSSQLERNLGADDNNLNSIFYEHLTRSLQHYLCGDLMLGRWGPAQQGDCFVLASDYLNCLVHIVEMGNGLVSFQLRGLEFRGTYCQQREVEAISERPDDGPESSCTAQCGCGCGCGWGGVGGWRQARFLPAGTMWALRWLAWRLANTRYVLETYSVTDNSAASMLQLFDFRKHLLTYYVKSIIYYTIQSNKLDEWLANPTIIEALKPMAERNFVDLDPIFNVNLDEDYDFRASGITRSRFCAVYQEWIMYCHSRRPGSTSSGSTGGRRAALVSLCFGLSLVGRRALAHAQHMSASSVEVFLCGVHALFKGDFRVSAARDEWVLADVALLHALAAALRMALKLHQDHFMFPDEYSNNSALHAAIAQHTAMLVICHEASPLWRHSVLAGKPHLLALRHVMDEGSDDYKIIMLNKRHIGFRVIKLNRECVRGLWAGQQHELIYLRNRNPERGSIQNAKQVLRNIINSSCDQPIGYPIYVSPLTTSYADTSPPLIQLVGGAVSARGIANTLVAIWRRLRGRCGEGCSSGAAEVEAGSYGPRPLTQQPTTIGGTRGSLASAGKPTSSTLASLATLLRDRGHEENTTCVYPVSREERERQGFARRERHRGRSHCAHPRQAGTTSGRGRRPRPRAASCRRPDDLQRTNTAWEPEWRDPPRRSASNKGVALRNPAASGNNAGGSSSASSAESVRGARADSRLQRYFVNEGTSKDLSKPSKEIRHERESYRELTGRYIEKPESIPMKETHFSTDVPIKEPTHKKDLEMKTKIRRSDSSKSEPKSTISVGSKVLISEPMGVYDCINLGRRIDVQWPSEGQRRRGGRNFWGSWVPVAGMDGLVVHKWTPNHREPKLRSHVDKTILLLQIEDKFIPIAENCVLDLGDEV